MNWIYEILFLLTVIYYLPEAYIHYRLFHVNKFDDIGGKAHWSFGLISAATHILMSLPFIILFKLSVWQMIFLGCMYMITRAIFHDGFYNLFRGNKFFYTGVDQSEKFGYDFDAMWLWVEEGGVGVGKTKVFLLLMVTIIYKSLPLIQNLLP